MAVRNLNVSHFFKDVITGFQHKKSVELWAGSQLLLGENKAHYYQIWLFSGQLCNICIDFEAFFSNAVLVRNQMNALISFPTFRQWLLPFLKGFNHSNHC